MTDKRANGGLAKPEQPSFYDWGSVDWRCVARGETTLAEIARRLGASSTTVSRRYRRWLQSPDGTARGRIVESAVARATKDGQVEIVYSVRGSDAYHDLSFTPSLAQWLHDALGDALADLKRAKAQKDE